MTNPSNSSPDELPSASSEPLNARFLRYQLSEQEELCSRMLRTIERMGEYLQIGPFPSMLEDVNGAITQWLEYSRKYLTTNAGRVEWEKRYGATNPVLEEGKALGVEYFSRAYARANYRYSEYIENWPRHMEDCDSVEEYEEKHWKEWRDMGRLLGEELAQANLLTTQGDISHKNLVASIQNEIMGMLHASSTYPGGVIPESEYSITANVAARKIAANLLTTPSIKTDNTQALYNALDEIKRLRKELASSEAKGGWYPEEIKPCPYVKATEDGPNGPVAFMFREYGPHRDLVVFADGKPSRCFRFHDAPPKQAGVESEATNV